MGNVCKWVEEQKAKARAIQNQQNAAIITSMLDIKIKALEDERKEIKELGEHRKELELKLQAAKGKEDNDIELTDVTQQLAVINLKIAMKQDVVEGILQDMIGIEQTRTSIFTAQDNKELAIQGSKIVGLEDPTAMVEDANTANARFDVEAWRENTALLGKLNLAEQVAQVKAQYAIKPRKHATPATVAVAVSNNASSSSSTTGKFKAVHTARPAKTTPVMATV